MIGDRKAPATVALRKRLQSRLAERFRAFAGWLRAPQRPKVEQRRWLLLLAAIGFGSGILVAVDRLDVSWSDVRWAWLVIAAVLGVPAMTLCNALEYRWLVRLLARFTSFVRSVEVAVFSTAANLLPLPGGPLVRIHALYGAGAEIRPATSATVGLGGLSLGVTLALAGITLCFVEILWGLVLGVAGMLVTGVSVFWLRSVTDRARGAFLLEILAIKIATSLLTSFRLLLVGYGLGANLGWSAFVLAAAPVIGAVAVVVPAGLGIREVVSAGLSVAVGLSASLGFLLSAVDRVIGLVVHGTLALVLAAATRFNQVHSEDSRL